MSLLEAFQTGNERLSKHLRSTILVPAALAVIQLVV
jgi:hypothetical protein